MDLLDRRGRALRLFAAAILGIGVATGVVALFWQILPDDYSAAPTWFSMFTWSLAFVLSTAGLNALFAYMAKQWHVAIESPIVAPLPVARIVRR